MGIGEDDRIGGFEPVQIAAAFDQSFWRLAISRSFLCHRLIEAHQRSSAAMPEKNHLRNAGLSTHEIDGCLHIERYFLPPHRRLVVQEPGVEAKGEEAASRQFTAADVVQIICRAMGKDEGYMRRRPALGPVERGAQLAKANIFWVALGEASTASGRCGGRKYRDTGAWCPYHVRSPALFGRSR